MASQTQRTSSDLASHLDVPIPAARADGETQCDGLPSGTIVGSVQGSVPRDSILTEEWGADAISEDQQWVIDPLDSTSYISRHIAHAEGTLAHVASILHPIQNGTFTPTRGSGAQQEDAFLHVSDQQNLEGSFLSVGSTKHTYGREATPQLVPAFFHATRNIRMTGPAALDLTDVAAGQLDAIEYPELSGWAVAAGVLRIEEAVCRCTGYCDNTLAQASPTVEVATGAHHDASFKFVEEGCHERS